MCLALYSYARKLNTTKRPTWRLNHFFGICVHRVHNDLLHNADGYGAQFVSYYINSTAVLGSEQQVQISTSENFSIIAQTFMIFYSAVSS